MTQKEKCELAIERGYTYDSETGLVYNKKNKLIKGINSRGYCQITMKVNNKTISLLAHHFSWYCVNKECVEEIDHINGIRNDNRICNLKSVTRQQNQWNRTTAKGYCWSKIQNKWHAQIKLNKKTIYLGLHNTEKEARNAYLQAKEIYHKF
jgi:hypothetical protein